ncbi:ParB/RepB/Spo0J family partition protein [Thermoflexus sp.]|uniref:ParB/RepB/Spo0J family partition protein n=1 Tax=Thermoflexus sp. TaxID=1969742 RepID=UPI002ADD7C92|nr:ParB/RepB/Spo0J family partition protein [Thermoflexus sp.]
MFREVPEEIQQFIRQVEADGGIVWAAYPEPYARRWQLLVELPLDRVEPTPYQRDLSPHHVERLKSVIREIGRFIDPIVAVRTPDGRYWTPNGNHRREAMAQLGARTIMAILIPDPSVAYHILGLNTEKAHNLREKALEVLRMYRTLREEHPEAPERTFAFQFEEAYLITLGILYDRKERFAGAGYVPILRKVDRFLDLPMREAIGERERRAQVIETIDQLVEPILEALHEKGIRYPFLKQAVLSQVNPIRRKRIVTMSFDEVMARIRDGLARYNVEAVTAEELAQVAAEVEE